MNTHSRWATGRNPPPPPPLGGNFRPKLDRSISYPNPKLTCYAKIQCRLQELWPLESHSVKKKFLGGHFFFLVIGIIYHLQNNFQSFWAVKIFTFKFYEYSISFIYITYIRKKKLLQPFSQKVTNTI